VQLSHRLATIAECVPKGSKVVDVGTDHAYIPIYLIKNSFIKTCIATDINNGPLKKAKLNMQLHKVENIELKLTNGLQGVKCGEADTIIIAGMGGYLMIDILQNSLELVKSAKKLILQPQQDITQVRKFLHHIGFKIEDEVFIQDDEKYYTVITAVLGNEKYDHEYDYVYGKVLINKKAALFKVWMQQKQQKLQEIEGHLQQGYSQHTKKRKEELKKEIEMHSEVMACIF
jgi:tRNA (adenine22-N1)-methyltransferase